MGNHKWDKATMATQGRPGDYMPLPLVRKFRTRVTTARTKTIRGRTMRMSDQVGGLNSHGVKDH